MRLFKPYKKVSTTINYAVYRGKSAVVQTL